MASETISVQDLDISSGQTVFVPAYSEVYTDSNGRTIDLAVTLSVHNTDFENSSSSRRCDTMIRMASW